MGHFAAVLISLFRCEGNVLGQMELPVVLEGQVGLLGVGDFHVVLHQLDADVRGVEVAHTADQGVRYPILSWYLAVHLNLGCI